MSYGGFQIVIDYLFKDFEKNIPNILANKLFILEPYILNFKMFSFFLIFILNEFWFFFRKIEHSMQKIIIIIFEFYSLKLSIKSLMYIFVCFKEDEHVLLFGLLRNMKC